MSTDWLLLLWGALGGGAGAAVRVTLGLLFPPRTLRLPPRAPCGGLLPPLALVDFPVATFAVNMAGAFLLGILAKAAALHGWPAAALGTAGAGFCGGMTTASTLSMEAWRLGAARQPASAAVYLVTTVILGTLLAAAGWAIPG
jgi:CrcB protein